MAGKILNGCVMVPCFTEYKEISNTTHAFGSWNEVGSIKYFQKDDVYMGWIDLKSTLAKENYVCCT